MLRRLLPLTVLGLLPATALALPCPPPVLYRPPVVFFHCPPPVVIDPCWSTPIIAPAVSAAPPLAMPAPAIPEPAAPKSQPRVEVEPSSPPFKPLQPAAVQPGDPPTMPPLVIPTAPPPKPADPTPAAPKGLELKPANPGAPEVPPLPLPLPPKESKVSLSSPLTAPTFAVRLVPAAGPPPADPDAPRRVVFVNLTKADVVLTVAGETAVLPARHELTATVPARFQWRLDGGPVRSAEVPAAAPGAEVVIR